MFRGKVLKNLFLKHLRRHPDTRVVCGVMSRRRIATLYDHPVCNRTATRNIWMANKSRLPRQPSYGQQHFYSSYMPARDFTFRVVSIPSKCT